MKKLQRTLAIMLCLLTLLPMGLTSRAAYTPKYTLRAQALYTLGLFKGSGTKADGSPNFALEKKATRLEGLVMLIRLLGKETEALAYTGKHPFTDVPTWGSPYVAYAYNNGITNGTSATTFGSDGALQAQAYVTFLLRALGYYDPYDPFAYNNALTKGASTFTLLLHHGEFTGELYRDDCVLLSHRALNTRINGTEQTLESKLIADGVITPEAVQAAARLLDNHTHKYTPKVIAPDCFAPGITVYTCSCGHSYDDEDTRVFDAIEHNYSSTVVAPTPTVKGYTILSCKRCKQTFIDPLLMVDKLPSSINDWMKAKTSADGKNLVLDGVSVDIFSGSTKEDIRGVSEAEMLAYADAAAPSDFEDKKVEINRVDAEDRANMRPDGWGGLVFSLSYLPEGTLISHSDLKKTGSGQKALDYFIDTMAQIDRVLSRGRETAYSCSNTLYDGASCCSQYVYENGSYQLDFFSWGNNWGGGGGDNVPISVYLNALSYFGGEKMGIAVWSMMQEHLHHRDNRYMISDELAAKYGLKILHRGKISLHYAGVFSSFPFDVKAGSVDGLKVTDGKQTWTIDYPLNHASNTTVRVCIPAK